MDARPELFGRLTWALASQPSTSLADRLCSAFAQIVGATGAAITLGFSATDRHVLCASDETIEWIENLQDLLREGPGLDAYRLADSVSLTEDRAVPAMWPLLREALAKRGAVPRVHAFVMQPSTHRLGVVTTHAPAGQDLAISIPDAAFLANAVGVAILGEMRDSDFSDEKWAVRDKISQATGMVIAQLRLSPADALSVLRARAFVEDATLADVSRRVVGKQLRFSGDGGDPS